VVDKQSQAAVTGEGHLHFYLDIDAPTTPGVAAAPTSGVWAHVSDTSHTFTDVAPGSHTISAQLVNNDHTPVIPLVIQKITVTVAAPAATTPPTTTTPPPTSSANTTVGLSSSASLGNFLVDGSGMTLYWTTLDTPGQSNVTGATLAEWPVFYTATITVPATLNAADFGTITRGDGSQQTTYKGYPLYYYVLDQKPGDTLGQGVGNVWFVVNPTSSAPVAPTDGVTPY